MRTFRGLSVLNVSGIVQQRTAHDFDRPAAVVSDRRKRKVTQEEAPTVGFFWTLSGSLQGSLIVAARHELPCVLKQGRIETNLHDEEKLQRREEAVQRQLNLTVEAYAETLELFEQWRSQGVKNSTDSTAFCARSRRARGYKSYGGR